KRGKAAKSGSDLTEDARLKPTARLLIDGRPSGKIVRQVPPLAACPHHVTQSVEQVTQRILALRRILAHQTQVREQELPFRVSDVTGIRLPCRVHALTSTKVGR